MVCITEAARITRDRPARPLNAPSLLLSRRWRSELGGPHYDGAGNPLIHFTSLYPDPFLRSRSACARTARSARPDPRVTQFDLRVSPNFCCCPCSVRLCLSAAARSAIGSHEARARSTPRATSGRSATWRSRGELESGLPPGRVPVDPKTTIQEYHGVLAFRSRHLHQATSFLRDCRRQF